MKDEKEKEKEEDKTVIIHDQGSTHEVVRPVEQVWSRDRSSHHP